MHKIISILVFIIFTLQGCALGIAINGNQYATVTNPAVSTTKGSIFPGGINNDVAVKVLQEYWGTPDEIERISEDKEKLTYHFGLRWNGIHLIVSIIPIPLYIPIGYNFITFDIEKGKITSAFMKRDDGLLGVICGWYPSHLSGCQAENSIGEKEKLYNYFIDRKYLY